MAERVSLKRVAVGGAAICTAAAILMPHNSKLKLPLKPETARSVPAHAQSYAGNLSLDGCDLKLASQQLRKRVVDGRSFTADTLQVEKGKWQSVIYPSGNRTIINPVVFLCHNNAVAVAGLDKPMRATARNGYDPIFITKIDHSLQAETDHVTLTPTTLSFERDQFEPKKLSGGFTETVVPGFTDKAGHFFATIAPLAVAESLIDSPPIGSPIPETNSGSIA